MTNGPVELDAHRSMAAVKQTGVRLLHLVRLSKQENEAS